MAILAPLRRVLLEHARRHGLGASSLARICERYLASYRNHSYSMARNGEFYVLQALRAFDPGTILDVGANQGHWSYEARKLLPGAEVHAFEIAPSVAHILGERFARDSKTIVNASGLSNQSEEVEIDFYLQGGHTGTTMMTEQRVHLHQMTERQRGVVERGDSYCSRHGLERIDFLKIDTEGAELKVLRGFEEMFRNGRIKLLQFEYNSINIGTRCLLKDFYELLEDRGFAVGKLWPRGASFGPYHFREENFRGPNYLAVHESAPTLRNALEYHPEYI